MGKFTDLTGEKFKMLTVLKLHSFSKNGHAKYICLCECGNETIVFATNIRKKNHTFSCGCHRGSCNTQHGSANTPLYKIWQSMKDRCENINNKNFKNYGGRGIKVSEEWKNFPQFKKWCLENGYGPTLSLDRKDNFRGYEPDNCKWATPKEQIYNRRNTIWVEIRGEILNTDQIVSAYGIIQATIQSRYKRGKRGEDLIATVKPRRK